MKDKTDKPVISYYLGNNYIITCTWDEKSSVYAQWWSIPTAFCHLRVHVPQLHQFGGTWNFLRVQCVALYITRYKIFYFPIMEPSTEQNNHLQIKEHKIHIW